ncbi:MAG: NUDIX domain-containing protein [Sphingobacteriales bacterium]|nr:MAG: NUDIX domain-containing protein [Sphingobacteriales bacterium]
MKKSAGILLYRNPGKHLELMLVHPGGPFWKNKDAGAWSIPKGEFTDEDPLEAARREFREETGLTCEGDFTPLTTVKQKSGKLIYAWALEYDVDVSAITSNTFPFEWPPKSGKMIEIPEVDRAGWFTIETAKEKIVPGQVPLIEELALLL